MAMAESLMAVRYCRQVALPTFGDRGSSTLPTDSPVAALAGDGGPKVPVRRSTMPTIAMLADPTAARMTPMIGDATSGDC